MNNKGKGMREFLKSKSSTKINIIVPFHVSLKSFSTRIQVSMSRQNRISQHTHCFVQREASRESWGESFRNGTKNKYRPNSIIVFDDISVMNETNPKLRA